MKNCWRTEFGIGRVERIKIQEQKAASWKAGVDAHPMPPRGGQAVLFLRGPCADRTILHYLQRRVGSTPATARIAAGYGGLCRLPWTSAGAAWRRLQP
jgi:hypothetical protein